MLRAFSNGQTKSIRNSYRTVTPWMTATGTLERESTAAGSNVVTSGERIPIMINQPSGPIIVDQEEDEEEV